jgi:hypothetical protein
MGRGREESGTPKEGGDAERQPPAKAANNNSAVVHWRTCHRLDGVTRLRDAVKSDTAN